MTEFIKRSNEILKICQIREGVVVSSHIKLVKRLNYMVKILS